jgi:hypothetical protein
MISPIKPFSPPPSLPGLAVGGEEDLVHDPLPPGPRPRFLSPDWSIASLLPPDWSLAPVPPCDWSIAPVAPPDWPVSSLPGGLAVGAVGGEEELLDDLVGPALGVPALEEPQVAPTLRLQAGGTTTRGSTQGLLEGWEKASRIRTC